MILGPKTEVVFDLKLDSDEMPRPEQSLSDFVICDEIRRLFTLLDALGDGAIDHVEVRAGIPRRVQFKAAEPVHQ